MEKREKKYEISKIGDVEWIDNEVIVEEDFFGYFDEEEKGVEDRLMKGNDYIMIEEGWG